MFGINEDHLKDFINVDDNIAVSSFPDNDDIVQIVKSTQLLEEDVKNFGNPHDTNPSKHNQIFKSFKSIKLELQQKENVFYIFEYLNKFETFFEHDSIKNYSIFKVKL